MEVVRDDSANKVSAEADNDLLIIISWKDEVKVRNEAFAEFHRRYMEFLYSVTENICKKFPNSYEMSRTIANNVFCNVYDYSSSFNANGPDEPVELRKRIERWLIGIAKTELKALLTNYKLPVMQEQFAYKNMMVASEKQEGSLNLSEKIVKEALAVLPKERDQHILITYWMYYEKGKGSQSKNMPDAVLDELSARYKTTKLNIRKIVSRSNKIVKEYIEKNFKIENNVIRRSK